MICSQPCRSQSLSTGSMMDANRRFRFFITAWYKSPSTRAEIAFCRSSATTRISKPRLRLRWWEDLVDIGAVPTGTFTLAISRSNHDESASLSPISSRGKGSFTSVSTSSTDVTASNQVSTSSLRSAAAPISPSSCPSETTAPLTTLP